MEKEKIFFISNIINNNHCLYFRLYNVLYKIVFIDNTFYIKQFGVDNEKKYSALKELFDNYIVYGNTLIEQINDIKLCDDEFE